MKNKELIELLQTYPEDVDVTVFGVRNGSRGCYEYDYLDNVEISFDKKYKLIILEGSDEIKISG